jgi:hypothetical protein
MSVTGIYRQLWLAVSSKSRIAADVLFDYLLSASYSIQCATHQANKSKHSRAEQD